ncbi:hypothetical protein QUB57_11285 [Microcoleus sp. F6_C1]
MKYSRLQVYEVHGAIPCPMPHAPCPCQTVPHIAKNCCICQSLD